MTDNTPITNALRSLDGLSVGDAFGELFFRLSPFETTNTHLPDTYWQWTDDTHMALSIVEILRDHGHINQEALAKAFTRRYAQDPARGYGGGTHRLLSAILAGDRWQDISPTMFGSGSHGNGGAMRAAPIGGYFYNDLKRTATEAELAAEITHHHPEGRAGAIAVAVAAALAANRPYPTGNNFLEALLPYIPESEVKARIKTAIQIPADDLITGMRQLGSGADISAQDTVPFCVWSAAHRLDDYEAALWWTIKGAGDVDTTCAIVGGIVALSAPEIPALWLKRREPISL